MEEFLAAAEAALEAAGAVIRPHFRTRLGAELKADESPVTIADREAERAMRAILEARFPAHGIVGEEFGTLRPEAQYRWVLDPVDGTRAFITGRPIFGSLIALLDGDVPVLGIIDQPVTAERWIGVKGRETVFRGGFGAAGCRACPTLAEAEFSCTSPDLFERTRPGLLARLQSAVRRTTWGGDCYGYGLIALGGIDVIVEPGLQLWDWAALVPVIEGAGGAVRGWDGAVLRPGCSGDVVAVGDAALLPQVLELLGE